MKWTVKKKRKGNSTTLNEDINYKSLEEIELLTHYLNLNQKGAGERIFSLCWYELRSVL